MNVRWMGTSYYSKGRQGRGVGAIVPHISCCSSIQGIDRTFGPYSTRKVSTHYAVSETEVHQYVHEYDTAWSVGNWEGNLRTISIEHVGTTANPPTRACLDMGARLMADIAYRFGWSKLVIGLNVTLHKWYANTACPANMDYTWEIERANEYLDEMWHPKPAPTPKPEPKPEPIPEPVKKRRVRPMEMVFHIKGEGGTRYVCGSFQRVLARPEELKAIEDAYHACYDEDIPHVELDAATGAAFLDALVTQ